MSISNLVASPTNNKSAPRQRRTRPEVVAITVERVEHLLIEASKTDGAPALALSGLDDRISALEDAKSPSAILYQHDARLKKVEEALRANGYDRVTGHDREAA